MDNRGKKRVNYGELLRVIAGHWKPVFQNQQFRKEMIRGIVGTFVFTAVMIFMLSLGSTGKQLGELMKKVDPPPGAVKIGGGDEKRPRTHI